MAHVYLERAPRSLFTLYPDPLPAAFAPATRDFSLTYPFNVSPKTFNTLLSLEIPVTIAIVYATAVWSVNRYNKARKNKPWRLSRTRSFFYFVIAHNVALAVYSGWTAVGMFRAIWSTLPSLDKNWSVVRLTDSLCKLSGPPGLGNAIAYEPATHEWSALNRDVALIQGSLDSMHGGRLWNEGLAYYGWIFYLSKFYEVVDTLIILVKGKKSSLLQTYHHAGAMVCMWAGIRYMSPPIWMFVQVNSFIHTMMYSYYTLSALGVRVPMAFKQTLTTMQILQLVTGASYALLHLIISYDVPVQTPYVIAQKLSSSLPSATSSVVAAVSSSAGGWLKKIALRAAGEEGLAANVGRAEHIASTPPYSIGSAAAAVTREEIRYRLENTRVHCIDTSGQAFAILLNVVYLMPLTYLFVRFFIRAYLRRAEREEAGKPSSTTVRLRASSTDAVKGVQREIREAMGPAQGVYSDHDFSGTTPVSSPPHSVEVSAGAATPPTVKPANGKSGFDEGMWFGVKNGDRARKASTQLAHRDTPSPSPSEARRNAEEAVRRAYESAEFADRTAAEEEADSILSVETTLTVESSTAVLRTEARSYEVTGVDEVLNEEEVEAEQELQPSSQ